MKTLLTLLTLCLPLLVMADDRQALRDLRAVYEEAAATGDIETLRPHLAEDFTAVMITAHEIQGFDGVLDYWKLVEDFIGEGGSYQLSIDPDETIFEGDIAIAKGRASEQVTMKGGRLIEFTSLWTAVLRKEDGVWKLVRVQGSIDPVSNPIIDYLNRAKLWIHGGIGLVIGLIAGCLLWRRRRVDSGVSQ